MITGPKFKICRRLGSSVFAKCESPKFGQKMIRGKRPKQKSEFGLQLIEKQKVRFTYGIQERQFGNYVKEAATRQGVNPAERLYQSLETRLDNVVYRLGFAHTRGLARQMVSHGHIHVGGRKVNIPSYAVKPGEVISIRPESKSKPLFAELATKLAENKTPQWLTLEASKLSGKVEGRPLVDEATEVVASLTGVIEFYSR